MRRIGETKAKNKLVGGRRLVRPDRRCARCRAAPRVFLKVTIFAGMQSIILPVFAICKGIVLSKQALSSKTDINRPVFMKLVTFLCWSTILGRSKHTSFEVDKTKFFIKIPVYLVRFSIFGQQVTLDTMVAGCLAYLAMLNFLWACKTSHLELACLAFFSLLTNLTSQSVTKASRSLLIGQKALECSTRTQCVTEAFLRPMYQSFWPNGSMLVDVGAMLGQFLKAFGPKGYGDESKNLKMNRSMSAAFARTSKHLSHCARLWPLTRIVIPNRSPKDDWFICNYLADSDKLKVTAKEFFLAMKSELLRWQLTIICYFAV